MNLAALAGKNGTDDTNVHLPHQESNAQARGRDVASGGSEPEQITQAARRSQEKCQRYRKKAQPQISGHVLMQ